MNSDKDKVVALHKMALQHAGAYARSGKWEDDLQDIAGTYLKNGEFLVMEVEGEIVAMGALRKITGGICELKRMRVDPRFQRNGFGQKILALLEARASELGFSKIVLDTTEKQKVAQALYLKNGYLEVKREINKPTGMEFVYYEKNLL